VTGSCGTQEEKPWQKKEKVCHNISAGLLQLLIISFYIQEEFEYA
jgi:hypothetical protein